MCYSDSGHRDHSIGERLEFLHRGTAALDHAMILLNDVIGGGGLSSPAFAPDRHRASRDSVQPGADAELRYTARRTRLFVCREFEFTKSSGKEPARRFSNTEGNGAPGEIRTPGLLVRSQALYPTELRARKGREY
jgi:hypothetical protein